MKKRKKTDIISPESHEKSAKRREGFRWLILLLLWSVLCVSLYILCVNDLNFVYIIHIYMILSIVSLGGALFINAVLNARNAGTGEEESMYLGGGEKEREAREKHEAEQTKMKKIMKAAVVIGMPPFFTVLIDYLIIIFTS